MYAVRAVSVPPWVHLFGDVMTPAGGLARLIAVPVALKIHTFAGIEDVVAVAGLLVIERRSHAGLVVGDDNVGLRDMRRTRVGDFIRPGDGSTTRDVRNVSTVRVVGVGRVRLLDDRHTGLLHR
jgi:hypothetical protein